MKNEELRMRNVQGGKSKIMIYRFSFFIVLFSFLFLFGCRDPLLPFEQENPWVDHPDGKGSFSLSVTVTNSGRTIIPVTPNKNDLWYWLVFTPSSPGAPVEAYRNYAGLSDPVYLDPGIYKLVVTAYLDEDKTQPVAQGKIDELEISARNNISRTVALKVFINEEGMEGYFTYNVTFPDVKSAEMEVTPLDTTLPGQIVPLSSGVSGELILKTGYYNVEITLERDDGKTLVWFDLLHIYASLESIFTKEFTIDDFYETTYTVTFVFNNGDVDGKESVVHGTTVERPSPNPEKSGYTFDNWYTTNELSDVFDFDVPIMSDTTLYAGWTFIDLPLGSVNDIEAYLDLQAGGNSADDPVTLLVELDLGVMTEATSNWQLILAAISEADKYVNLDLSLCTIGGNGGTPGTVNIFDPYFNISTGKDRVVSIVLPNVAISIPEGLAGSYAPTFNYFTNLKSFSGTGLKTIASYAFYGRTSLTQASLPEGIIEIGDHAFQGCTNLALTSLPTGITEIALSAFEGCTNLALTSLPTGLTSIGPQAFYNCTSLALTSLPTGLSSISDSTFSGCTSLALTSLPEGLSSIGFQAFFGCTSLSLTELPEGITSIGESAFRGCTSLIEITLLDKITSIGDRAFYGCTSLAILICHATTPPILGGTNGRDVFRGSEFNYDPIVGLKIYVPAASVDDYRNIGWSTYRDIIYGIGD